MEMQDVEEFDIEEQSDDKDEDGKKLRPMIRSAVDLQRLKLEKLMKNPDKPVIIPELPRERDFLHTVPSFVRNVMGSSAGAGSGEFHVYRHLRRKEYARQKYIQSKSIREQLDDEFQAKLEQNKLTAEAKTAKKRAKRQKRKAKMKQRGKKPKTDKEDTSDYNDQDSSNESSNDEKKEDQTENVQDGEVKEEEKSKSGQEEEKLDEKSTESTTEEKVDENRTESTAEENLDEKSTEPMADEKLDEKTAEAPVEEKRQECERRPANSSVTVENELSLCQEDVPPLKDCDTEEKKSAKCIELNS